MGDEQGVAGTPTGPPPPVCVTVPKAELWGTTWPNG